MPDPVPGVPYPLGCFRKLHGGAVIFNCQEIPKPGWNAGEENPTNKLGGITYGFSMVTIPLVDVTF